MIIFPAIDLRNGNCVRLRQGDPDAETVFGDDPAAMALHWESHGAEWLHVVNLDGALGVGTSHLAAVQQPRSIKIKHPGEPDIISGNNEADARLPINLRRLRQIRDRVGIPIQFGGGLRTVQDIELVLKLGADRVVLGTVAVEQPEIVTEAIRRWGADRVVVGIDARDGKVATHGWQQTGGADVLDIGHRVRAQGAQRVVFTDIARDGMLTGVNLPLTTRLGDVTGLKVIASGGVADIADVERLKAHEHFNIEGVIVGQAIYTGALDLQEAITVGHRPLAHRSAGIIPFRRSTSGIQYLLLCNLFCEQWQFPRGGGCESEGDEACALRRFQAETGLPQPSLIEGFRVELNFTSTIRDYSVQRTIVYYLAEAGAEQVRLGCESHCEARWVSYEEAWELLSDTGPEQLSALEEARAFLETSQG